MNGYKTGMLIQSLSSLQDSVSYFGLERNNKIIYEIGNWHCYILIVSNYI